MKKIFCLLMALCMLLCACAKAPEETTLPTTEPTEETTVPTTVPTEPAPTTEPTEPETEPTEPEPQGFPNPLTGELMAEPYMDRIYAVVVEDDKKSLPHWGVGQADILYEMPHEFGITRMVALYTDVGAVEKVGPNRSARPYLLNLAQSYDAIFVHAGGSTQAYKDLKNTGWNDIDGVKNDWDHFKRDKDRLNAGVSREHTMYTTGEELLDATKDHGYKTTRGEVVDYGLSFAKDGTPEGESAETINIRFQKSGKKTNLYYNAEAGTYTMEQYDRTYVDGNTGNAVEFENVLILKADVGILNDYGALTVDLVDSGSGYFACGGKMVPIHWSRSGTSEHFVYTLEDGTPLTLGVGTSYIAVVYSNAPVSFS